MGRTSKGGNKGSRIRFEHRGGRGFGALLMLPCKTYLFQEEGPRPITIQNLKDKHKHTVLALHNGAKGRQESKSSLDEMCVKRWLEVHPEDLAMLVFLCRQDVCNEMVPIEEPAASEDIQDIEDRGTVLLNP